MRPEVMPFDKVVAGPVGNALLGGQLESTIIIFKHSGTDRVGSGSVLANAIKEFKQETVDWDQSSHATGQGGILTFSSGQGNLCDELGLPNERAAG